jgi:glyoxylase-like metal-dependent hydrolase (beta-lactamase superfamily II)
MAERRKRWRAVLALLIALGGIAAVLWFGPPKTEPPPAAEAQHVLLLPGATAVAPDVYLLGAMEPAAAYVVDTSEGLVLLDSGLEDSADAVTAQLAVLRLDIARLRAILLTHVHADHSLGAEQLRRRTGARVYAGRADCSPLRRGGPHEAFFGALLMPQREAHPTSVDVELAGDEVLAFGGTRFRVLAMPGHTPGSICYQLERPDLRALFTGDVIQCLKPAAPGDLGTYTAQLPPLYRGSADDYLASLRRLRSLPPPDLVLPGHPRMDSPPQDPRLTSRQWHDLLDRGIAELERVRARYQADGADFLDGHPRELLPGLHYLGDCGQAVYALDTGAGVIIFDAPGGPRLAGFLKLRFEPIGWGKREVAAVLLTSADDEATEGLASLVKATGCRVAAPESEMERVRRMCPANTRILDAAKLGETGWFDGQMLPLAGRGRASVAYRLRRAGKTVLVSGRIPVKLSHPSIERLRRDLRPPGGSVEQYRKSLDLLEAIPPDLWLPAVPVHGQNANLYDADWKKVLDANRHLVP